jgi:geranylgeranyl pyrophosphate synthase
MTEVSKQELCRKILDENGGAVADRTRKTLLDDAALKDLSSPLEFLAETWRDPLVPAMMSLSCKAVGGDPEETHQTASAMSLINLSFRLWDDIIDKTRVRSFRPTLYGKFGEGTALIIGGLASAKAFSMLEQVDIAHGKRLEISKLLWNFLVTMAKAEKSNLGLRTDKMASSDKKFCKIKAEAADLGISMKIGAILGGGSRSETRHLGKYGESLGLVLELWKDFHASINLTLELLDKIKNGAIPYALMWASEHSESLKNSLKSFAEGKSEQIYIKRVVREILGTDVFNHTVQSMEGATKEGVKALTALKCIETTIPTLQFFIEAQPELFTESLPIEDNLT